ncbi:MAG TPA: hypothetical protein VM936_18525 [Pyrinomonadaceae bacterium]|jgi:uncharacterized delta-60 repeat protein/uncharacterized repeat protein (TIGR01451 family)|nr:hypothetical protein [Pyrinomonadaceae bacterium]
MSNGLTHAPKGARLTRRALAAVALASALLLLPLGSAFAVNLNTVETPVTQNFDTMTTSATSPLPADFKADKGGTRRTPGAYSTAVTATEQPCGGGNTASAGGIYNCGSGTTTTGSDRAVGFLASGTVNGGNLYGKYTNTTGAPISALRISYDVEKYRNGTNAAGFRYQLFYSTTGAAGSWTSAGADFLTAFAGPDANNTGFTTAPGATVSVSNKFLNLNSSPIANNSDIYLAWNYAVTTGSTDTNAQLLAVDNISVTPIGGAVGATGVRTTDIQGTDDGGYAMALQPDGKIVVGGYAVNVSGNKDFALVRYNYDGSLDTTFGGGTGKVVTDFNGTSDRIWGVALQSDGKIVAAGETVSAVFPGTNDIALARYNTNGTLDTTFNVTGKVTTDHGGGANNAAYAVALSGTNIVVAGYETVSGNNDFMIARYTTAGVLDPTFGTLGVTTEGFSGFSDVARAVAIDGSGRIVVGGHANNGSDDDFAVARFTSGGVLDTSFVAGAGKAAINVFSPGSADQAFGLAINPVTQSIVLAGSAYNNGTGNKDFALVRYFPTGALDGSFGSGGVVTTDFGSSPDVANSVYVRSDGVTVAAGFSRFSTSSDDFALARYTQNGGLDTTFDGDGKLTMRINNADERAYAVAQDFSGKIVAAGFASVVGSNPVQHNFALARFNPNGTLDSTNATALNSPDLLVQILGPDNPNSVVAGSPYQYSVTVTNRGGARATNVVLADTLSAGVTYDGAIVSHGTVNVAGNVITNNIGTLNPGEVASLDIDVIAGNTPMLVSNTAAATLGETDPTPSNNTATEYTRIVGVTDLSFSPSTVFGGCQNSTGTVTLSGPAPANGVMVHVSSAEPTAASAPAQVLVPGGQTSAQFTVTTSPVVTDRTVRFEVTLGPTSFVRRLVVKSGCF